MAKADEQRQALLATTIEVAAQRGLGEFSLRHLATAAGASTTLIFQNFNGKADLLVNAVRLAAARDRVFHEGLLAKAVGLLNTHISFADFLAHYVMLRPSSADARFLSEMLVALDDYPECHEQIKEWISFRTGFWTAVLGRLDAREGLADVVAHFVMMEEFYAYALHGEIVYGLLLSETCRAVCEADFHGGASVAAQSGISLALGTEPLSLRETESPEEATVREQLLAEALRIIEHSGLEALNQRRIAKDAGVSASAITYHFKDMKSFRTRAVWRALVQDLPTQLDPEGPESKNTQDISHWLEALAAMLEQGSPTTPPGFYVGFSRLTAQACLLSRSDDSLVPLISYLRELEGWGTYRVSRTVEPLAALIRREHAAAFGMWIKAQAILLRVGVAKAGARLEHLELAARHIFPER